MFILETSSEIFSSNSLVRAATISPYVPCCTISTTISEESECPNESTNQTPDDSLAKDYNLNGNQTL